MLPGHLFIFTSLLSASMLTPHPCSDLAIEAHQLVKSYGDKRAIDGIDLSVRRGSIYGVLGPNGAGKTTTVRVLATLLRPDGGTSKVTQRCSISCGRSSLRLSRP